MFGQVFGWKLLTTFRVIFVMGGPACGKGTVCAEVMKRSNSVHVSSGDLLRTEVQRKTPLGLQVRRRSQSIQCSQSTVKDCTAVATDDLVCRLGYRVNSTL